MQSGAPQPCAVQQPAGGACRQQHPSHQLERRVSWWVRASCMFCLAVQVRASANPFDGNGLADAMTSTYGLSMGRCARCVVFVNWNSFAHPTIPSGITGGVAGKIFKL